MSNTDFDPDAYLSDAPASAPAVAPQLVSATAPAATLDMASDKGFDPDSFLAAPASAASTPAVADTPQTIGGAMGADLGSTWQTIKSGLGPSNEETYLKERQTAPFWDFTPALHYYERAGKGLLSAVGAPLEHGVVAPLAAASTKATQWLGLDYDPTKLKAALDAGKSKNDALKEAKENPAQTYERWRNNIDLALLAIPGKAVAPKAVPPPVAPETPFGLTLSQGEQTGNLADRVREQSFLREGFEHGQNWGEQRAAQMAEAPQQGAAALEPNGQVIARTPQEAADIASSALGRHQAQVDQLIQRSEAGLNGMHESIRAGLSPTGTTLARDPMEAADIMSNAIANEAERAQAAKTAAYKALEHSDVVFHPAAFNNAGQKIRALVDKADKIDISPELTPIANQALNKIDSMVSGLVQQRDEFGRVLPREPITPERLEDVRKRLNAYMGQAKSAAQAGKPADAVAMRSVIDAFDDLVENRIIKNTVIRGNPLEALSQMRYARGLNAAYRKSFTPRGPGDSVGRAIQTILGRYEGTAATPEQVQGMLYSPKPSSVQIANRLKTMFGADSPEFGAARQGFYSYLTERPPGLSQWGPEKVADRIDQFTQGPGRTLAQAYLEPSDITRLQQFGQRLRSHARGAELAQNPFESADFNAVFRRAVNQDPKAVGMIEDAIARVRPDSPQSYALRQGLFLRAVQPVEGVVKWGPKQIADNLQSLLASTRNSPIYSAEQRGVIKDYVDTMRKIEAPRGINAPSEPAIRRLGSSIAYRTAQIIGAVIFHKLLPVPLIGELTGIYVGGKFERAAEALALRRVRKQLPLLSDEVSKYQKAYIAWQKSQSRGSEKLLRVATSNLANELQKWGIPLNELPSFTMVQSPGNLNAEPNQQNIPGPPADQNDGTQPSKQQSPVNGP